MFASKRQTAVRSPRSNSSTPSCPFALTVRAKPSSTTNLVCQQDPPKSVRAHRSCSFPTRGRDQTPQRSRPNLRRPFAPTVQVRSRPEFATKPAQRSRPSTSVSPTYRVHRRPAFRFVHDQRSRPNPPSVRFRPRRPFTSTVRVRSRPEVTTKHDQRPRPDLVSFLGAPTPCRVGPHDRVTRVVQTSKRRAVCLAWLQCVRGCRGVL